MELGCDFLEAFQNCPFLVSFVELGSEPWDGEEPTILGWFHVAQK